MTPQNSSTLSVMLNKVPEITLMFWVIKILSTTVGETAADFLSVDLNFGLVNTSWIMLGLFSFFLIWQLRQTQYTPWTYWLNVVLISVVGTLITDNLVDNLGVSLETASLAFTSVLAVTFWIWYKMENTLSIQSINTRKREGFYWLAILFTFALGTALGDLMAEALGLGYATALGLFSFMILLIVIAHFEFKLNAILTFWLVYILTRPLGASLGDYLSQDLTNGGLGLGASFTSLLFLITILLAIYGATVQLKNARFLEQTK